MHPHGVSRMGYQELGSAWQLDGRAWWFVDALSPTVEQSEAGCNVLQDHGSRLAALAAGAAGTGSLLRRRNQMQELWQLHRLFLLLRMAQAATGVAQLPVLSAAATPAQDMQTCQCPAVVFSNPGAEQPVQQRQFADARCSCSTCLLARSRQQSQAHMQMLHAAGPRTQQTATQQQHQHPQQQRHLQQQCNQGSTMSRRTSSTNRRQACTTASCTPQATPVLLMMGSSQTLRLKQSLLAWVLAGQLVN